MAEATQDTELSADHKQKSPFPEKGLFKIKRAIGKTWRSSPNESILDPENEAERDR